MLSGSIVCNILCRAYSLCHSVSILSAPLPALSPSWLGNWSCILEEEAALFSHSRLQLSSDRSGRWKSGSLLIIEGEHCGAFCAERTFSRNAFYVYSLLTMVKGGAYAACGKKQVVTISGGILCLLSSNPYL